MNQLGTEQFRAVFEGTVTLDALREFDAMQTIVPSGVVLTADGVSAQVTVDGEWYCTQQFPGEPDDETIEAFASGFASTVQDAISIVRAEQAPLLACPPIRLADLQE